MGLMSFDLDPNGFNPTGGGFFFKQNSLNCPYGSNHCRIPKGGVFKGGGNWGTLIKDS